MAETGSRPSRRVLEEVLLGAERRYTRGEAADKAGVPLDFAQRLWQALGFAGLPDEEAAFTDGDVDALRKTAELVRAGFFEEERAIRLARATGQTMARLAEWQTNTLLDDLIPPGEAPDLDDVRGVVEMAEQVLPEFETLLVHVWRRQLAASLTRALAAADTRDSPGRTRHAIGFADLVSFTRLARGLDETALAEVVEGFETAAADTVADLGGRLVKTLGDEVLFVAASPRVAAEIGLRLAEAAGGEVTEVRVGLAYGPVLSRMGDVFGTTVNLASRITGFARPGTVLVDRRMAAELDGPYEVVRIRVRPARGLGLVQPYVLRRSPGRSAAR